MNIRDLQAALVPLGNPMLVCDGDYGPATRAAVLAAFTNLHAELDTLAHIGEEAILLHCSLAQIRAAAAVESAGGGFDKNGRPKILYERHKFHRATGGVWSVAAFSNEMGGGYGEDSWRKLLDAIGRDVDAAFGSCSWGKFQVMGEEWKVLGYRSAFDLAHSCVTGEAAHYDLFARFIKAHHLEGALGAITGDAETCRAFASGYNGRGYRVNDYHTKLAREFARAMQ